LAETRGGYRPPSRPAPVSGPGRLSRRTDARQPVRSLSDAAYGEQATYRQDQQGAPMAKAPSAIQGAPQPAADLSSVVPFDADSERPGEPVTAGAELGDGPGPESLGMSPDQTDPGVQRLREMLPMYEVAAMLPTATVGFRQFVRRLRGMS
jgi:hypothetical protein